MRDAPGTSSNKISSLPDNAEVTYTGNKTDKIDGYEWAEVTYHSVTGWVAADYLRVDKPKIEEVAPNIKVSNFGWGLHSKLTTPGQNSNTPVPNVTTNNSNNNNIDPQNPYELQEAFQSVGDYDGVEGLQCVDFSKWYIDSFTINNTAYVNGCDFARNIAKSNGLTTTTDPCSPAVYSVAPGCAGPSLKTISDDECGHTGIVISANKINNFTYSIIIIHIYSDIDDMGIIQV